MSGLRKEAFSALVADGSSFHRGLMSGLVRSAGATKVYLAEHAAEALRILQDANPELVVVDYAFGPDGAVGLSRRIRRDAAAPNRAVPIIVLTTGATRAGIEDLRANGVDAVLAKPCSPLMMQEKVATVLAENRPFIVSAEYVGPCRRRRHDPAYKGPLRRLEDPEHAQIQEAYTPPAALLEALSRLSAAAAALLAGGSAQQVLSKTLGVKAAALDADDADLAAGAQELLRYLEAVGATPRLSPQAVQVHIKALNQIVVLGPEAKAMRAKLSDGLKRLVVRKLEVALAG